MDMRAAIAHLGMLVHLEIESFYLFSKFLLDRTARLMHWWFGDTRIPRGLSSQRHSQLVDHLSQLIVAGQLVVPEGILDLARALQTRISDYRADEVVPDSRHALPTTHENKRAWPPRVTKVNRSSVSCAALPGSSAAWVSATQTGTTMPSSPRMKQIRR
jgi:hypothetical protein